MYGKFIAEASLYLKFARDMLMGLLRRLTPTSTSLHALSTEKTEGFMVWIATVQCAL